MSQDVDAEFASFWQRSKLLIPVYNTETGRDLRTASSEFGEEELLKELFHQIFSSNIHWKVATRFNDDASHVVDFGTGGLSGIGSLTARESEGKGLRVVLASTGTNGRNTQEVYSATSLKTDTKWMGRFGPRLVRTRHDGKIHLDTAMSRLLSKPPLMVAGMTPCTVMAGFNAAVANAGYHIELAGGGHYNARRLRDKVSEIISKLETPGIGITLNALYINQRQFTFQLPEWIKMKSEGIPVEGLCVAAGIPSTENATNILTQLREGGLKHVSFKPGSVEGIRQVVNIAAANPDFPIIMQWTGGRAGGHHSCEDFHQPILSTYASIRQQDNIVLVGGSGFGESQAKDVWPYLNGEWATKYGAQRMPFDGFLYASRVMVAKEAHTSLSVKELIVAAPGVGDDKWESTYDKETGGIITVTSELGEPIHKVATRGVKLWKEFDSTVFALPREKRAAWLADRKDYVIKRLNADFQKPWFAAKADGTVCDLGDMTYAEVASRMVRLMYVAHEKRWIDPSLRNLTGDWLRRTEDRLSEVNDSTTRASALQSYNSLNDPQPFLESFFARYPAAKSQIIASEDIAYFLAISNRPGQKPTPFIPVLDADFGVWFKKDSLWFAEDVEAVFDQDPQRVCILMGPVAVQHCKRVDEPISEMFGGIKDSLIKNVLDEFYGGDESKVPEVEYLAPPSKRFGAPAPQRIEADVLKSSYNIKHTTKPGDKPASTTHIYEIDGILPPTNEWLEHLSGPKLDWLRAFLTSVNVAQGKHDLVDNGAKKLFKPRNGQRVEVTLDQNERPLKVAVFGAIRN